MKAIGRLRRALLVRRLAPLAKDAVWGEASEIKGIRRRIRDRLDTFSDPAVRAFVRRCAADEDYGRMLALALFEWQPEGLLLAYTALGWGRRDERAIHGVLRAGRALPEVRDAQDRLTPGPSPELQAMDAYVRAVRIILDEYRGHGRHSRAAGILRWEDYDASTGRPADPALAKLILDRPDDAERIADIVIAHRTGRAAEVAALLDGEAASALAEGAF